MLPTEYQKFTRFAPFAFMGIVVLLGGVIFTVFYSQQSQNVKSKANYSGTISYVGGASQITNSYGAPYIAVPKPSGVVEGDFMIAEVAMRSSSTPILPPPGWTLLRRDGTSSPYVTRSISSALYYKEATSSEPTSYQWAFGNTQVASAGIVAYRGVNEIDAHSGLVNPNNERVITATSITTRHTNTMLLFIGGLNDNPNQPTISAPYGMTERVDRSSDYTTTYFADQQMALEGPTGNRQTPSNADSQFDSVGQLVALQPDVVQLPTPTTPVYYYPTATPPYVQPTTYYYPTATPPYVQPTTPPYGGSNATANLKVFLHGIGNGGDNVNPTSQGNASPQHTTRTVDVQIFNAANQLVTANQTTVNYDSGLGGFTGQVNLGAIETGPYTVKIKTNPFLRRQVEGIQNLIKGQNVSLPATRLVVGDINNDNLANILDYNILIGCYSDLTAAASCTPDNKHLSDLNDDDSVNQYDYNLFIRELSNLNGQ